MPRKMGLTDSRKRQMEIYKQLKSGKPVTLVPPETIKFAEPNRTDDLVGVLHDDRFSSVDYALYYVEQFSKYRKWNAECEEKFNDKKKK